MPTDERLKHGTPDVPYDGNGHDAHAARIPPNQGHSGSGAGHHDARGDEQRAASHVDHTGHERMFRRRFWICLLLSIPVLAYSPALQQWLGFTAPAFPGSQWIPPVFTVIIFAYGGVPFLRMALPELRKRRPGMMTLISLASRANPRRNCWPIARRGGSFTPRWRSP
jgi:Cu2+-exporting ATPase